MLMNKLNVLLTALCGTFMLCFLGCQTGAVSEKESGNATQKETEKQEFVDGGHMPVIISDVNGKWCGTWASSQYYDGSKAVPISNRYTLRQIVRTSIGGEKIRLSFTNRYGESELIMNSVHIAKADGQGTGKIFTDTDTIVPFDGKADVTIPAGEDISSDAFEFSFEPLTELAITIYYEKIPAKITGHVGARAKSFYSPGNCLSQEKLPYFGNFTQWYTISAIDVLSKTENKAIVCFGDSITDGRGTTDDKNNRWTDGLATRLQADEATKNIAVLNQGIGGTLVTSSGVNRFNTDVLEQTGLSYVIILYGINDIIYGNSNSSNIINAYKNMITKLHKKNVLVYGGTILPFGKCSDYTSKRDGVRQEVNEWIRETSSAEGGFDGVIDFDYVMKDPSNETKMLTSYDSGDGLHPGPTGYKAMADAIDLELFTKTAEFNVEDSNTPFTAENIEQFWYGLPKTYSAGKKIIVNVKGINNGSSGFRCWTIPDNPWTATSNLNTDATKLAQGEFDISLELVTTDTAKSVLLKGVTYGEAIENLTITALSFTIDGTEYPVDPGADVISG